LKWREPADRVPFEGIGSGTAGFILGPSFPYRNRVACELAEFCTSQSGFPACRPRGRANGFQRGRQQIPAYRQNQLPEKVFILEVLTHSEYDKGGWKK
jgi:hypothetical protein